MGSDLFDKLRQMQRKKKTFDELPDMNTLDGDDGLAKFDLMKFKEDGLNGIREGFEREGKQPPEMKVVAVAIKVVLLNPMDPKRDDIAMAEVVAWHKHCGDPKNFMNNDDEEGCSCGEESQNDKIARMLNGDGDEPPYRPGKYEGTMYG